MTMRTKTLKISFEVPVEIARDLADLAGAAGMPRSQYIRLIVADSLRGPNVQQALRLLRLPVKETKNG